ncbi:hypothetical protein ACT17_16780 [Mycolicibacterium conceptionense]|jgi:type VII secretion integral membrane protein EccD|uniref:EccD-like transmembrane domain-containing protein n=3 Tax=Mycolicibacterium TaxID=1866885 RepID=A0ABR5FUW4_9MYCO|nr:MULTISPECIES: type VII secretion integral membrane protein EccD [Mycolicibacterium]KLI09611.1 hypothetical protein AA982_02700 [Mycolicibacterium senegalense]KLO51750.1 hypothetical protein ABW05_09690 [Mycolicibacterium senegalense]KMV17299.1 hypothetical protein ACT17_16780 [Mycolicibacterium conceptionense]OBK06177.1 type VII secretion integral membrane protein EccD [Mycolicibacterium conceptionense]OMB81011.1 type VII secretion integral membrane protein EccD [Mycolicibacterium conceptio
MPDSLCHVSVHCGPPPGVQRVATVDLALPAAMTVAELLPWIVDILGVSDGTPRHWRLARLGGDGLDTSATLMQNDIHDGDLLVLTEACGRPTFERPLTAALAVGSADDPLPAGLRVAACLWACALGLVALAWAGIGSAGWTRIATAAVVAVTITAVAVSASRLRLGPHVTATLNVAAVAFAGTLGFLVVPAGPASANFFLAATAAASLGVLLIRTSPCGRALLLAVVTGAGALSLATGISVLWAVPAPAVGAMVSAVGLGLLPLTPRLSIALAGLTPMVPGLPGGDRDSLADNISDDDTHVVLGHRNLVGLVAGGAAAGALGTTILALSGFRQVTAVEVAFAAAVGVALLLRSRTYASGHCRAVTISCGVLSLTAAFALVVVGTPAHGSWIGIAAVGAGVAALWPVTVQSPVASRIADVIEYAALAAVVPLACWLAGVFDVLRELGLR